MPFSVKVERNKDYFWRSDTRRVKSIVPKKATAVGETSITAKTVAIRCLCVAYYFSFRSRPES